MAWYRTGTVAVTNGQTSVTGTGTRWASNARVGDAFRGPDGNWYEVANIASETVMGIFPAYQGPTVSGGVYEIAPIQGYVKESADRLREVTDGLDDITADVEAAAASAAAALASQNAAKTSEDNAKVSETNAKTSETNAAASAAAALASQTSANTSETNATNAAASALASQNAAKASEDNAYASSQQAAIHEAGAETAAQNAQTSATNAATSETNAAASASAAATSETNAANSETNAASSESTASTAATTASNAATRSEQARDEAIAAASSVTGGLSDGGAVDLSGGVYPTKPTKSTFWKVTVGGTVDGITYGVGDTLVYTYALDEFYKIDNTESVSSVAGKTGVVTLDKVDVGLPNVDNTSDANKPVSTAQQTALNAKVNIADIKDDLVSTDVNKPLSANQGRVLSQMIQSASQGTIKVYSYTVNTNGQVSFSGADDNGVVLTYIPGSTLVTLNGVNLVQGPDYTATNGTSIVLTKGAKEGSILQIQAFGSFSVANTYTKAETDDKLALKATTSTLGTSAFATLTTSTRDGTVGRVLRVGDHGVGGSVTSIASTTLDGLSTTGVYYVSTGAEQGSAPVKTNGYIEVIVLNDQYSRQIYTTYAGMSWERVMTSGTWQPWRRTWTAENFLGTVSQSGGIPTGAIIERGSNGWGEYIRWADGTQICTFERPTAVTTSSLWSSPIYISPVAAITYPAAFVDIPRVSPGHRWGGTGNSCWAILSGVNSTGFNAYAASITNTATAFICYNAIGRWY